MRSNSIFTDWVVFHAFLSSADFFQNQLFLKTISLRVSNSLDQDQARHFVGPDLGPNFLQIFSAEDTTGRQIVH